MLVVFLALSSSHAADKSARPRIIDGKNVPASDFPTVGMLSDKNGFCSATLIGSHFVLTAAHCVVDGNSTTGKLAVPQTGLTFVLGGVMFRSVRIFVHPTYKGTVSQEIEGEIDLAIVQLDQDATATPSPLSSDVPAVGTLLILAGYGEQGTGLTGTDRIFPADGRINTGTTPIDRVTPTFTKWMFDAKPAPDQEANTAPGDSGGPQFISVNGALTLVSVTSGGSLRGAGFGDLSYNTRVDIALPWINSIVNGAGSVPGNNLPLLDSFSASPQTPAVGQPVTFTALASDPDNDALYYEWDFGDGTQTITTPNSATHRYAAEGNFTVQVTVNDINGGAVQQSLSVSVTLAELKILKQKFTLNFAKPLNNKLSFTAFSPRFIFASNRAFKDALGSEPVIISIDTEKVDSVVIKGTRGRSMGTVTFNLRRGTLRYSGSRLVTLTDLLKPFGAVNETVMPTVIVPFRVDVGGIRFGGNATFAYSARAGKTGTGK